jgi:hypothetical protein
VPSPWPGTSVATHNGMRRPTETRLRRAFADVLTAVLATSAAGLAGCGGSTASATDQAPQDPGLVGGGSSGTTPGFQSMCTARTGQRPSLLASIHATPALDGAVIRDETAFARVNGPGAPGGVTAPPAPEDGDGWTGADVDRTGTVCATATDAAGCRAKVAGFRVLPATREACAAQFPSTAYEPFTCRASYILYTRGDEIGVARTSDEIKALMATFDTLEEAMWAAGLKGLREQCAYPGSTTTLPDSEYRTTADGGWDLSLLDEQNCGAATFKVVVHVDYAGNLTETSRVNLNVKPSCAIAGRRPEGFRSDPLVGADADADAVGEHFASMATLEAASVIAFRRLHRQLKAFGAPRELLDRVRKAARDEIRHARATGALARKYGVTPSAPALGASDEAPSLFAIALENAREGCVRETFGALVAHLQTTRAADPDVRACMAAIAGEETEHAALSWDVAAWIESQLSDDERARLAAERHDAFTTLARELAVPVDARVARVSGVPDASDAVRMLHGLAPMLLAA